MPEYHDCLGKATAIQQRTGILLGLDAHNIISQLCLEWGCQNADEFYQYMRGLSDDELRAHVERVRRKKFATNVVYEEVMAIA